MVTTEAFCFQAVLYSVSVCPVVVNKLSQKYLETTFNLAKRGLEDESEVTVSLQNYTGPPEYVL